MRDSLSLLALFFLASPVLALSPKLDLKQYTHTVWTEGGGEALPPIQAFAQTRDGYLWLATRSAHLRFDGMRFSRWPVPADGPTQQVIAATNGAVWLAGAAGLTRIHEGKVQRYPFDSAGAAVNGIIEDTRGVIWVAVETDSGSFLQSLSPDDGAVHHFGARDGIPATLRAIAPDGAAIWLATDGAVCRWIPGARALCQDIPGPIQALARAGPGAVFAAGSTSIFRVTQSRVETISSIPATAGALTRRMLLADRQGNLWAGATAGLLRIRGRDVQMLSAKTGLSGDVVTGILEDTEGDIWVATDNGIDRLRDPRILHVSPLDRLSGESTTVVKAAADGSIWVGTAGNGLNRITDHGVSRYSMADGLPGENITAIEIDGAGRVWVASGEKLAVWQNGRFSTGSAKPSDRPIFSLAADPRGRVWAASGRLLRISGAAADTVDAGEPADALRVFATRLGPLWLASASSGVRTLDPSGVASSAPLPGLTRVARAFAEDTSGAVWTATGAALHRVRGGKVTTWSAAEGLSAGDIHGLTFDQRGALWILTDQALVRVALSDLDPSPDGAPRAARFRRYDEKDGFRPSDRAGMPYPRITTAVDGRIWVCERGGVGVLDPELLRENPIAPPVVIEQLLVDGVPQPDPEPRFYGRQVQVAFTANSLMDPERVSFRYRMDGRVDAWTDIQGRRELTFVDLPPGNYRFHVAACNLDNICNDAGAVASFVVLPYYHQTVWFKLLLSALAWAVIWGGYKLRMRQVVSRYRMIAEDRARVTREIHDSLLQGFAGVVLQLDAAARLFESNPTASKERLERALDQADESLREARQMLLDLRLPILEGRPLSEALAEVGETTTRGTPIDFSLKVRGNERPLAYSSQVALYLIGREAIRNAVTHANPGRITALLAYEDRECSLRVQDDGAGFDLETDGEKPGHLGVQGMRERASDAGAKIRIETTPGAGTVVEVTVSYKAERPVPAM